MNTRPSIFTGTFLILALLAPLGACVPPADTGGSGSGGKGSGGSGSGGSGSGGSGSGGSGSGGHTGSGSGGSGSGGNGSGGSGSGGSGSGGSSGSGGASELATFANARDTIDFFCTGPECHRPGENEPAIFQLHDDVKLYNTLTTFKAKRCGNFFLVKPGSPQESALYLAQVGGMCKDVDTTKPDLLRMPYGCEGSSCTGDEYLEGIRQWIANGAKGP